MKPGLLYLTTLFAILLAVGIYSIIDSLACAVFRPTLSWSAAFGFPQFGVRRIIVDLWPTLAGAAWVASMMTFGIHASSKRRRIAAGALASIAVAVVAVHAYIELAGYEPFRGYLPFIGAGIVWVGALVALIVLALKEVRSRWLAAGLLGGLVGSVGMILANYAIYSGLYPTLHHATVIVSLFSLIVVVSGAANLKRVTAAGWVFTGLILALVAATALVPVKSGHQRHLHFSELGRLVPDEANAAERRGYVEPDPGGVARFQNRNSKFDLPADFHIEDYNVLLVGWEATRFDRTSFNPEYETTPNLLEASKTGAVYSRAYSPSSGTLHSLSSMFTMSLPSSAPLTTWMRPWNGVLSDDATTVAEYFEQLNYDTWWVGHNYEEAFTTGILGLTQGFDSYVGVTEYEGAKISRADQKIAKKAVEQLKVQNENPEDRFFGFIFFVAPHGPYSHHKYDGMPTKTAHDRYLLEVKYVDEQFGKVWDFLQSSHLKDNTIVVFFSDHGEEFGEHGGVRHKSTVYTESIHVPHIVWIPGVEPRRIDVPASTMWALPSLLLTSKSDEVRLALEKHAKTYLGPLLRETSQAPVSELIGHDRIKASLVTAQHKINHDYRSGLFELFDLSKDPYEQDDLFDAVAARNVQPEMSKQFASYENFRAAFYSHKFEPKKRTPINKRRKKIRERKKKRELKKKKKAQEAKKAKIEAIAPGKDPTPLPTPAKPKSDK